MWKRKKDEEEDDDDDDDDAGVCLIYIYSYIYACNWKCKTRPEEVKHCSESCGAALWPGRVVTRWPIRVPVSPPLPVSRTGNRLLHRLCEPRITPPSLSRARLWQLFEVQSAPGAAVQHLGVCGGGAQSRAHLEPQVPGEPMASRAPAALGAAES